MKNIVQSTLSLIVAFTLLFSCGIAYADIDITVDPLEITDFRIKHTNHTSNGNQVFFEVKFNGDAGPYICNFFLYNEYGDYVDSVSLGPCYTDGFGWNRLFTQSGYYTAYVLVENGLEADFIWTEWMYVDATPVLELN